ncbi:mycofactocin biosynthesis glycosyltransferase MftF [Streptomyces viridiviolaceus]
MTPAKLRVKADGSLRRLAEGRVLLGGSPLSVMRLTARGARLLDEWLGGAPVSDVPAHRRLVRVLTDRGAVHPVREGTSRTARDVTVVVPVRDDAEGLARLLPRLTGVARTVVVDDGSAVPVPGAAVRHESARGPAAARNAGWRLARTEFVLFCDADVVPEDGWLEPLLRHMEDADVAAVAPRVLSVPGAGALARYEEDRPSLDLGGCPAPVRPGSRVSYVPAAALLVRTSALRRHGGFDEGMRFGEDVDLVWRMAGAGDRVRYEAEAVVRHRPRPDWTAWVRQRFGYGTSAAPLALRHGGAVAPVRMSPWTALAWAAVAAGRPWAGAAVAGVTASLLPRKLAGSGVPADEALRLALLGHLGGGRVLADAVTRAWWPVAVPVLAASRPGRLLLTAAFARHVDEWRRVRPRTGLPQWCLIRIADDAAYGAGVWWGALRHRTVAPLLPDLADWPPRAGRAAAGRHEDCPVGSA